MRIISGKHKNRLIPTTKKFDYRPSTAKFREALFSILSSGALAEKINIKDSNVLDLFAGSGSLAFEALSRGAGSVTLIDTNRELLQLAREFAKFIGEEANVTIKLADATALPKATRQYNIVFMDPPYKLGFAQKALDSLVAGNWLADGAIIAIEIEKREKLEFFSPIRLVLERIYGNTKLVILSYDL